MTYLFWAFGTSFGNLDPVIGLQDENHQGIPMNQEHPVRSDRSWAGNAMLNNVCACAQQHGRVCLRLALDIVVLCPVSCVCVS